MTKASGGDGIPVELFQIVKNDAVKVLHSICQQIWKTQQWPQDWKRSVFIPIPKKKKCKKAKSFSEEALQTAVKRREAKDKKEKERYTHLNAEFQIIARRDKKVFLNDQCEKKTEENNRMGKTRDLFKEIRDTKGTFHAKMSTIKDRNGTDLTEAEDIKKRWARIHRGTIQKRSA